MRDLGAVSAAVLGALSLISAPAPATAGTLDSAVLAELNFARTRPAEYGRRLQRAARSGGEPGYSQISNEDPDALAEAIRFLMRQKPLPPLQPSPALTAAARAHARAQGRTGQVGHVSPGGQSLGERLRAHGVWAGLSAENISYGYDDPQDVVRQLIVDSRVPGRGHRKNIFGASYQQAGVSCAPHREWGAMCVIDFAGAIVRR